MQLNLPGDTTLNVLAGNSEGTVFAATSKGVYKSLDSGLNWINAEITTSAYRICIDKEDRIFTHIYPNIHYSVNNGDSWSEIICPPVGIETFHFNKNTIVFGNWGSIYKSDDFGDTWEHVLEGGHSLWVVNAIVENSDGILFAGVTDFLYGGGVYRSVDGGDTWELTNLIGDFIWALGLNSQGAIFAGSVGNRIGVFRSYNNGDTWQRVKSDVFVEAIAITPDDVIYIGCSNEHGSQGGVFRSDNHGETWELINSGLVGWSHQNIYRLSLAPNGYLYAYSRNHLHRSVNPVFDANAAPLQEADDLTVFPNPFIDFLHFQFPNGKYYAEDYSVNVFDPIGRLVFSQELGGLQDGTINLSSLPQGLYYISVEIRGQRFSKPIVKNPK